MFSSAFASRYAKTWTSKFRKVVWQHIEAMVGSIIWLLLEIYLALQHWKNWQSYLHEFGVLPVLFWDSVYSKAVAECCFFSCCKAIHRIFSKQENNKNKYRIYHFKTDFTIHIFTTKHLLTHSTILQRQVAVSASSVSYFIYFCVVSNSTIEVIKTRAQLLPRMADRTRAVQTTLFTSALRRIFSNR